VHIVLSVMTAKYVSPTRCGQLVIFSWMCL